MPKTKKEIMKTKKMDICPLCGGTRQLGKTTFTAELGFGIVVIRQVPATICVQCGADWIDDDIASQLEKMTNDARKKHSQVEVLAFV